MDKTTGKREWVYPAWVKGRFQEMRRWAFLALQALLFVTPWIHLGGHQLVLVDLPARQVHVAGDIFGARDTIFLVIILLFLAFLLFLVTALWGRVWCGYACPQTVFLETFVHRVERWLEGERGKRMALDRAPWSWNKIWRKSAKWAIFLAASWLIAMTFVSWFAGTVDLWTLSAGPAAYGFVAAFTGVMFLDFAWFREQFCNFLCPYARFQGAIAGPNSLTISYDVVRGEPRRQRGVKVPRSELGACIGCDKCVAVCPQGIDIRDGFQLECIACAKCVDACTLVMGKLQQPTLVRYTTVVEEQGGHTKLLRPRPLVYGGLLVVLATAFLALLGGRHTLDVTVNRAPGTLFTVDEDGWTRNTYLVNVANKKGVEGAAEVAVSVEGLDGAEVIAPPVSLATGEQARVPLVVRTPPGLALPRTAPIEIRVRSSFDDVRVPATYKSGAAVGEVATGAAVGGG